MCIMPLDLSCGTAIAIAHPWRFAIRSPHVRKLMPGGSFFEGHHIFTPHADVPDDGALRLVILAPEKFYSKQEMRTISSHDART